MGELLVSGRVGLRFKIISFNTTGWICMDVSGNGSLETDLDAGIPKSEKLG